MGVTSTFQRMVLQTWTTSIVIWNLIGIVNFLAAEVTVWNCVSCQAVLLIPIHSLQPLHHSQLSRWCTPIFYWLCPLHIYFCAHQIQPMGAASGSMIQKCHHNQPIREALNVLYCMKWKFWTVLSTHNVLYFPMEYIAPEIVLHVTINTAHSQALQENIACGCGFEANIALDFASCYIGLLTTPLCNIYYSALTVVIVFSVFTSKISTSVLAAILHAFCLL